MSAEATVIKYLSGALDVSTSSDVPNIITGEFVTVERTGSSSSNGIEKATLAIQSWAESTAGAMVLNEKVKKAMADIVALPNVSSANLNSDYNYSDTSQKIHRYQAVYDVVIF